MIDRASPPPGTPVMTAALERRLQGPAVRTRTSPPGANSRRGGPAWRRGGLRHCPRGCWRPGLLREVCARKAEGCGGMARAGAPEPGGIRLARVRGLGGAVLGSPPPRAVGHGFRDGACCFARRPALEGRTSARDPPTSVRAVSVAKVLARIHAASANSVRCRNSFRNQDDFLAIRIEPYLHFTASRHPDLARQLHELGEDLHRSRQALVHGDVSPKNILFRGKCPILLDAECATMGDPAFDVAFCLNHLAIKSIHRL